MGPLEILLWAPIRLILFMLSFCRLIGIGICSGLGRFGAMAGVVLGEYQHLHLSAPVLVTAGAMTLASAFIISSVPDYTKHQKLPENIEDLKNYS